MDAAGTWTRWHKGLRGSIEHVRTGMAWSSLECWLFIDRHDNKDIQGRFFSAAVTTAVARIATRNLQ